MYAVEYQQSYSTRGDAYGQKWYEHSRYRTRSEAVKQAAALRQQGTYYSKVRVKKV